MITRHDSLFYTQGSSDKQYDVIIESVGSNFQVSAHWGRRGNAINSKQLYDGPISSLAESIADRQIDTKLKKGYTRGVSGAPFQGTVSKEYVGFTPTLLAVADRSMVRDYVTSDDWVLQQKYDGVRLLVKREDGLYKGINRKGLHTSFPQQIVLCKDGTVDGELVQGIFYAFDLIEYEGIDESTPYMQRLEILKTALGQNATCQVAPTYVTSEEKAAFLQKAYDQRAEGLVFKRKDASIELNTRSQNYVKFKFWNSATFRVVTRDTMKNSVGISVLDGTRWQDVGNCTIPVGQEIPRAGEFIEVKYLYAYKDGSIYQPQYKGRRTDVTAEDARIEQLVYKAEASAVS